MQRQLDQARVELQEFTYAVSHDLRAPLRHISAFALIIEEDLPDLRADIAGHLATIRQSAHLLTQHLDGLASLSRLGLQAVHLQPTPSAVLVAEVIAVQNRVYDAKTVPAVIFVDPEIASAGLMESECKAQGMTDLKIGKFPFAANGRAGSMMETEGFIKIIADAKTHVGRGVHIVGPDASNLISEAVLAIERRARREYIALSIHPPPTSGERRGESAEAP